MCMREVDGWFKSAAEWRCTAVTEAKQRAKLGRNSLVHRWRWTVAQWKQLTIAAVEHHFFLLIAFQYLFVRCIHEGLTEAARVALVVASFFSASSLAFAFQRIRGHCSCYWKAPIDAFVAPLPIHLLSSLKGPPFAFALVE